MDTKRFLVGTVTGAVVLFAVGFLFWGVLFAGFFEGQQPPGLVRETPILWSSIVSALLFGAFLTLIVQWTGSGGAADGFKMGALVGLLVWGSVDLLLYGNFNFATLTAASADIVLEAIHNGLAGAAIALAIGGGMASASAGGASEASRAA